MSQKSNGTEIYEVKGVCGSFQYQPWHIGDGVRLNITYHKGHSVYIVTNQERIKELWLPALKDPLLGFSWSRTLPEGEGVEIVWSEGLLTMRPSYSVLTYGNVAVFTGEQTKTIYSYLQG